MLADPRSHSFIHPPSFPPFPIVHCYNLQGRRTTCSTTSAAHDYRPLHYLSLMNPNYSFPRQGAPLPRTKPLITADTANRTSNALRASVLDVALELGIGNNNTVTNWMFNNSLEEEDEVRETDSVRVVCCISLRSSLLHHPPV